MRRSNTGAFFRVLLSIILGLGLVMSAVGVVAAGEGGTADGSLDQELSISGVISRSLPSLAYARVVSDEAPVYADPAQAALGISPTRSLGTGYVWVSLADRQSLPVDGRLWYLINENEYVRADQLEIYQPSAFHGVALSRPTDHAFAWIVYDTWASSTPGATPQAGALFLPRYTRVTIYETQKVGEWNWYRIGAEEWIEQRTVGVVKPASRPEGVAPTDKWIEINLYEQTLAAYEGDQMVYATLVSSGLPWWQTEPGLFRVWAKVKEAKMSGRDGYPDYYFLEDVPWTMYFNKSFALHGAYWHDRFGYPHSHGCVNLPSVDARWLFEWATPATGPYNWSLATEEDVGTWVWVHDGELVAGSKLQIAAGGQ